MFYKGWLIAKSWIIGGVGLALTALLPVYGVAVVHRWPHDPSSFTEGLEVHDSLLYEGTGLNGKSGVRITNLASGAVVRHVELPDKYFGEGITVMHHRLYELTWKSGQGFIYDANTLERRGTFRFSGEGWGLTHNATSLIMSDGTSTLRFLDPNTLSVQRALAVSADGQPVEGLNELEWVDGQIWANIWRTPQIARISPESGRVVGWIDLSPIMQAPNDPQADSVANGIAYDSVSHRIFVTGKHWSTLYEIRLTPPT